MNIVDVSKATMGLQIVVKLKTHWLKEPDPKQNVKLTPRIKYLAKRVLNLAEIKEDVWLESVQYQRIGLYQFSYKFNELENND